MSKFNLSLPFKIYRGTEPYIFISYSHKDLESIFADLCVLHDKGYRIWYDEGIIPGKEWSAEIEDAISGCAVFLVFISPNAIQSKYVLNEINYALEQRKIFLAVHIEETHLPTEFKRMQDIQAILRWQKIDAQYFKKLAEALPGNVREFRDDIVAPSAFKIVWSELLKEAQRSPIRAILPLGREILCINSSSPDRWVYAIHASSGSLLWTSQRAGKEQKLKMLGWTYEYLYLTGEMEVEQNFYFVEKIWLREGDKMASIAWYETPQTSRQKYDAIPEWDSIHWTPVSQLENADVAKTSTIVASIVNEALLVQNLETQRTGIWKPPAGDTITSVAIAGEIKPVVALSSGHVCLLQEVIS